jgi:hypothetical protein
MQSRIPIHLLLLPVGMAAILHVLPPLLLLADHMQIVLASTDPSNHHPVAARKALLLDIDNTLYQEKHANIESQIVAGTHRYCQNVLGISKEHADDLFREYGSTIEGLRQTVWKDLSPKDLEENMKAFYHTVYASIDPSRLLVSSETRRRTMQSSGYHHHDAQAHVRRLLLHSPMDIMVASNSPSWHVQTILRAMGLAKLPVTLQYTPDRKSHFPTKHRPHDFFANADRVSWTGQEYHSISFVDDSRHNLIRVQEAFSDVVTSTHHVNSHEETKDDVHTLSNALLQEYGLLDPSYTFSQIQYLESKNKVDRRSIHVETWNEVIKKLDEAVLSTTSDDKNVWIVDLGAGLLSILELMLHGDEERGLLPFSIPSDKETSIQYTAFESNQELYGACHDRLRSWGFQLVKRVSSVEAIYEHPERTGFQVRLIMESFSRRASPDDPANASPNLIVGCCFADLMDPDLLAADLIQSFSVLRGDCPSSSGTLIYFPITFAGITQFLPARPFEHGNEQKVIPSDTVAFRWYSNALTSVLQHNLDPHALIASMEDHGAEFILAGSSDWKIDPQRDTYLYETMLYFFGSTAGPSLLEQGYDAAGWIQRARSKRPSIQVTNQDLLFRMTPTFVGSTANQSPKLVKEPIEILFTAPYKVTTVDKALPSKLGPRQVLSE